MPKKYSPSQAQILQLENNLTYHQPISDQQQRYEMLRVKTKELGILALESSPPSREQSLAMTKLEEFVMWINASIARNEKPVVAPEKMD